MDTIDNIVTVIRNAKGIVYTCGNGGSSATASHFTQDLIKTCKIKSICLTDNIPWITATSNDDSYNNVFSAYMDLFWNDGDILFLISGSGNSQNLVNVAEAMYGKIKTIALVGFGGGKLKDVCDFVLHYPIYDMRKAEDKHLEVIHTIIDGLVNESIFNL